MTDRTVLTVGSGKQFQTINAAIQAADQMGGNADIKVDAGTYTNDGGYLWDGINNVTIEGVGGMVKIVDPTYYAGGKAAIVTGGQNIALKNLDISGVTVPDGNGAGIRYDQGTLLLDNVHLHHNQNGILGAADATGSITIQNSEIDHNGTSAGNTHNIYIGDVANFTLTNSYVHDANVGHEVKSRAENNTITGNRILDNNGTSSYAIDLPNGGNATITGNVIEQGANNPNHTINAYGEEGNPHAGTTVNFSNNTVVNDDTEGRGPLWSNNGATITGTGNTVWNTTNLGNGVSPASFTALSARPTLDTSSTNTNPAPAGGGSTTTTPTTGGSTSTPVTYPTQTVLTVGSGKQFQTINAAIQAADQMGGNADIKVDAGTYTNDGGYLWDGINNVTIEGVGGMVKIVDPTYYAGGKAAIVTGGQNIALKNLDISGVTVPDGNGAGIRYDQGTLLLDNVHLHHNQNGILGAADATGSITIQNSEIDHNGTSAGNTHNIYIGDVANFTLTNSYVHDANVGHEVKSRAENNTITGNRILDNNGTSSYAIDLPNGGNATITGNVIEQGANNPNHTINAYGEEGNPHAGTTVNFSNNTVVNDDTEGRGPLWSNNGATITGTGNTVWNTTNLGNGVSPASFTALSARPTLDTSSTNTNPAPAGGGSTTTTPTTGGSTSTPVTYPTQTVLTVGSGKQFQTINAAIQAADQMGGNADIKVDAGTYTNDGGYLWDGINNVTIEGVGGMVKIVDPTYYAGGKAAIVTGGQNIALKNLDISGVTVPDGNGAGIRYDQGTLLLDNVHLHHNQNGILGAADATGSITIQNSEIDHNGTSAGNTHNIYIGDVANFTLTNSYVHDANVGHEVKSRAENNTITGNRILDNNGTSSYAIDLPNGGNATITGNVIEQGANNPNHTINAYGEEGNPHAGTTVNFSNNTVVNDDTEGRGPLWSNNGATITGTGNTVWNTTNLGNGVSPASFTALSARPTLDTSSTNTNPAPAGGGSTTTTPTTGGSTSTPTHVATPPTVTVSQSVSGITTSTSNTLSGTVTDTGSGIGAVEIFVNTAGRSTDLGPATLNGDTWSYTASNLSPGTYTFYAVGFDRAGHTTAPIQTGPSETVVATVPVQTPPPAEPTTPAQPTHVATPPTVTVSQSVSGITTSTSNTLSGTVTDTGSGIGAVEIFVNTAGRSTDLGPATLNGDTWSYTASNLSPGTYTFYAVGFDRAGHTTAPIQTGPSETVVATVPVQTPPPAQPGQAASTQTASATSAAAFTGSVGVNTHLDVGGTYADTASVVKNLKYLGVSKVRDSMAAPGDAKLFSAVAAETGVQFNVYLSISEFDYDSQIAEMKTVPRLLTSVEGVNEGDSALSRMSYGTETGYAAIAAAQSALFNAIKSDPRTNGIDVIAPSYGDLTHFSKATNTAVFSDYANTHEYFGTGNPPGNGIRAFLDQAALVSGADLPIATEAGYYTGSSLSGSIAAYQHSGVSEIVQAKYNLTLLFDNWKAGVKTTYLYELVDRANDPSNMNSESHFGLFNADGTPKLAATAVRNLLTTLADSGDARTDVFGYQIAGAPSTANSLLIEKSTGAFDLAVWNDIRLSDATTGVDVTNPAVPVTINFGQYVQSVTEYDPLTGTRALLVLSNVDHVSMNLPDHPVILEIMPYAPAKLSLQSFVLPQTVASTKSTSNLASILNANAVDADFNALLTVRITAVDVNGTKGRVAFDASNQSLIYTAPTYSPLSPTDSFTYTLSDKQGDTVTGTVAITETPPANSLYGIVAGDRINAPASGWTLTSLAMGEQLYSDYSDTTFIGGADTNMYGGTANNVFTAGDGTHFVGAGNNALITLGNGNNTLGLTGSGNTVITGSGNNLLWKSTGDTRISMGDGNHSITAGGRNNTINIGRGTSTIDVGNDGNAAGNEHVTVAGGSNSIRAGGSGNTIIVKDGESNHILSQGNEAEIIIQAGTNSVIAQGANSIVTILAGSSNIATNGDGDVITLGSGQDTVWAAGNSNQITAGSGSAVITFIGERNTIDLTHGTNTLMAQGAHATIVLGAPDLTPAQVFGNVVAADDSFDLRTTLAATNWDGHQSTLASYLSVSNLDNRSTIAIDADGAGSRPAVNVAILNDVAGLTYGGLLAHAITPTWK